MVRTASDRRVLRRGLRVAVATVVLVLALTSSACAVTMVRRFCNVKNGSHFWSASGKECADTPLDSMRTTFNYEGIAWAIKDGGNVTVRRAYNTRNGAHFYTASEVEYDSLPPYFNREGPAFKAWSSGTVIYRYYYKPIGSHFYTSNTAELAGNPNFQYEGPAFRVQTTSPTINAVRRWPNNTNEGGLTCKVPVNYQQLPDNWELAAKAARVEWNDIGRSKMCFVFADSTGTNRIVRGDYGEYKPAGETWVYPSPFTNLAPVTSAFTRLNTNARYPWVTAANASPPGLDVQGVITHELGHWVVQDDDHMIGQSWRWAVMDGETFNGPYKRTLAAEEIDGIRYLYGAR